MKLEKMIEQSIYDNGINRDSAIVIANNVMSTVRHFIYTNYIKVCEEQNGSSYCKNCGLSLDEII